jgi:hypothetical protein
MAPSKSRWYELKFNPEGFRNLGLMIWAHLWPIDGAIVAAAGLLLWISTATSGWTEARAANEEAAVTFIATVLSPCEGLAKRESGRYPRDLKEIAAVRLYNGPPPEDGVVTQNGYTFHAGVTDESAQRYFIVAEPVDFDESGARFFYTDDTGHFRESRGPVVGPTFPEVP